MLLFKFIRQSKGYEIIKSKKRLTIFLSAFLIRSIFASIFFGSVDTTVISKASVGVVSGGLVDGWPYFPMVHLFVWLSGIINIITPLPLGLIYKLIPIVFDSLIAVLIFDILIKRKCQKSIGVTILYIFSPVAILINSFHGQTDSICLFLLILAYYIREFYRESKNRNFVFGVLFGLSFIAKPISLIVFIIFFEPFPALKLDSLKKYLVNQLFSVIGLVVITLTSFGFFILLGYNLETMMLKVFDYSNTGFFMFGLPYSAPFNQLSFLHNRLWIMVIVGIVSIFYYFKKINSFSLILFSFAVTIGVAGLSPQYLIWIVPFLIITCSYRLNALYNLVGTVFLVFYYINPAASSTHWENMATFASLKYFSWFMPPTILASEEMMPVVRIIGDKIIPSCGLLIALFIISGLILSIIKVTRNSYNYHIENKENFNFTKDIYLKFLGYFYLIATLIFVLVSSILDKSNLTKLCGEAYDIKIKQYDMREINPFVLAGNYGDYTFIKTFNIIFILIIIAINLSIYAYYLGLTQYKEE